VQTSGIRCLRHCYAAEAGLLNECEVHHLRLRTPQGVVEAAGYRAQYEFIPSRKCARAQAESYASASRSQLEARFARASACASVEYDSLDCKTRVSMYDPWGEDVAFRCPIHR
jgi:hypothetical protein